MSEQKTAGKIKDYIGQTLTFVSVKDVPNKRFGGTSQIATVLVNGEDAEVWMTGFSGGQLKGFTLPVDKVVTGFQTQYNNQGVSLEDPA